MLKLHDELVERVNGLIAHSPPSAYLCHLLHLSSLLINTRGIDGSIILKGQAYEWHLQALAFCVLGAEDESMLLTALVTVEEWMVEGAGSGRGS